MAIALIMIAIRMVDSKLVKRYSETAFSTGDQHSQKRCVLSEMSNGGPSPVTIDQNQAAEQLL